MFALGGCSALPPNVADPTVPTWQGRLSVRILEEPQQSQTARFVLSGTAQKGTLDLSSPIGTQVARIHWSPEGATLLTPQGAGAQVQSFSTMDALLQEVLGLQIPLQALFEWLHGRNQPKEDWLADLQGYADGGRIVLKHLAKPSAEVRIVLERD